MGLRSHARDGGAGLRHSPSILLEVSLNISDGVTDSSLTRFESSFEGIAHAIRDRPLAVPPYQRSYAWKKEQVEQFWEDLRGALAAPDPEYFLGAIVVTPGLAGRMNVIDGQQRLATVLMLIAAIRDYFEAVGESEMASEVQRTYVASLNLNSGVTEPRLLLNSNDAEYFEQRVTTRPEVPMVEEHESNRRIRVAFDYLKAEVRSDAEAAGPNWRHRLLGWLRFLDARAHVIFVSAASDADAFLIFETLNDRGLPLSTADLLKNYLLSQAVGNFASAEESWQRAVTSFEGSAEEDMFTLFLRHYWSSIQGATRERELYRRMRSEVHSPNQALDLLQRLEAAAPLYAALLDPHHEEWVNLGITRPEVVESLLRLRLEQYRPLLLAAMEEFAPTELEGLLRSLVSWSVRGLIVGGIGGGMTERYYSLAAVAVRQRKALSSVDVFERLRPVIPSDEQFQSVFATRRITNLRFVTYLLIALQAHADGHPDPDLVSADDESRYILDRVLPVRADPQVWPGFEPSELGGWALRVGNAVLLPRGLNRSGGSDDFQTKRPLYESSEASLTTSVAGASAWGQDEVARRQEELASRVVEVWRREPQPGSRLF